MKSKSCVFIVMVLIILFSLTGCLDDPRDLEALKEEVSEENIVKIPADKRNFHWPYFLYIPEGVRNNPEKAEYLLVIPLNSGNSNNDLEVHINSARGSLRQSYSKFGYALNVPILVPIFPHFTDVVRDSRSYVQTLNHKTLKIDTSMGRKYRGLERVDLQLIEMIDDARNLFKWANISLDKKVLMYGFSSTGGFVNRFTIIHPERIKGAAMGAPHGWPVVPVRRWRGNSLPYEAGIDGLNNLVNKRIDLNTLKEVPLYFFLGENDVENDPVRATFNRESMEVILELFGEDRVERWPHAERIYDSIGANAEFVLYPNVGHSFTSQMRADVNQFFRDVISD